MRRVQLTVWVQVLVSLLHPHPHPFPLDFIFVDLRNLPKTDTSDDQIPLRRHALHQVHQSPLLQKLNKARSAFRAP